MYRIVHGDYKRIVDRGIFYLDRNYTMNFTVELEKNERSYHSEFGYHQKDGKFSVGIYRTINYYLSIESWQKDQSGNRNDIRVNQDNFYQFLIATRAAMNWLISKDNASLFIRTKDGNIAINHAVEPIIVNGIYDNTKLELSPAVFTNPNNGIQEAGIFIYINNASEPIFLSAKRFVNFQYFIENFNMYNTAQNMINYLGRPENGTNYNGSDIGLDPKKDASAKLNSNKQSGFLNRVGAKERPNNNE